MIPYPLHHPVTNPAKTKAGPFSVLRGADATRFAPSSPNKLIADVFVFENLYVYGKEPKHAHYQHFHYFKSQSRTTKIPCKQPFSPPAEDS
ncbi:hypothetical protein DRA42_11525 [Ethanoligenens harbinense]|nr:hypothetical protein CXQ68_11490 [Ethanoligenens harbinense YUAN-3]AYF39435.1 hypothetical protein CXP51_11385 [Ethanoligenens harbinense]AYF42259.1 hypothetical protein CN246_11930 [Ethanoligenens harbinense]QCN93015.1 hypothetical protein DRA42_11525 [Ethanoligenens harbinense]